ncbi:saccharopine dehydrogenase NADP-binding domain-containing protein [Thioclava electrotropha]|uniref:saccharopine dehydrogenase NADP-binding domain-containing protein n=1 Tax=Thioclava electrotropha TaxID=1549850 RepID=UPI0023A85A71|nr:saccharopine dehydrogenase NADP-binding domain-containing protein [Thioclava electrotropha]
MCDPGSFVSNALTPLKILALGGYGVFGARLAKLLVADGHEVCVACRNLEKARSCAEGLSCRAIRMDRGGNLDALVGHEVVVDAAGPFHAYGDDPYRLARAAIAADVHYLDLSDNAAYRPSIPRRGMPVSACSRASLLFRSFLRRRARPLRRRRATPQSCPETARPGGSRSCGRSCAKRDARCWSGTATAGIRLSDGRSQRDTPFQVDWSGRVGRSRFRTSASF